MNVLLADDHAIVREGLKLLLSTLPHLRVVGEAGSARDIHAQLRTHDVDLLTLDLGMPGVTGAPFIRELLAGFPRLKILVLTANIEPRVIRAALDAGAAGYLTKHGDPAELVTAIEAVQQGDVVIAASMRYATAGSDALHSASEPPVAEATSPVPLTPRELQVLALVAHGVTARDMGARLGISLLTARKHRENLMRKLELHSAAELTAYAVRLGLPAG
ncbi:response regulator [Lysobacter cavernae]|uniref:Response regulator n=1 Tax=Lysobacter cavernae TaxID=1685901 RepID=A0ABV7RRG7_9GAMM